MVPIAAGALSRGLYNQSLVPMIGPKKHPGALGQRASVVLAEIWQIGSLDQFAAVG